MNTIDGLREFNRWRRGQDEWSGNAGPNPTVIGALIDSACDELEHLGAKAATIPALETRIAELLAALDAVLELIEQWQRDGRNGHCLPVIRGELLEELERVADKRRTCAGADRLLRGEYICKRCGLRKDSEWSTNHDF